MPGDEYKDCLRIGEMARRELFDTLSLMESPRPSSKREFDRLDFSGKEVGLTLFGPGAGESHDYLTLSRNISASGLSILHGGFVYPDTPCVLRIPTLDGATESIKADVVHCRLVRGRVHELGLRFDRVIDPYCFVVGANGAAPPVQFGDVSLHKTALLLDDEPTEHALAAEGLSGTNIKLLGAENAREMLDTLAGTVVDLLICDLELGPDQPSGIEAMRAAREARYAGPIIAVTERASASAIRQAKELGVVSVLLKPYPGDKLLDCLTAHLGDSTRAA